MMRYVCASFLTSNALLRYIPAQTMRRKLQIKISSWLLILAVLTVAFNGVCQSAHAMQDHLSCATDGASQSAVSAANGCPCCPVEHDDSGACDDCVNCLCHASVILQPFRLSFIPVTFDIDPADPFNCFPEVYLPKFIPPQNLA